MNPETRIRILQLLSEGFCQADIARRLKLAPSVVHYHTHKFKSLQYIEEVVISKTKIINSPPSLTLGERGTSPILFYLTQKGKHYIEAHSDSTFSQGGDDSPPLWLLHHAQFKYPIIKDAPIYFTLDVQLTNWRKSYDYWKTATVERTTKHFIIHVKQLEGRSEEALFIEAREIADKVVTVYEGAHGMVFGRPTMLGKPHFVCLNEDPGWTAIKKGPAIDSKHAIIDKTPRGAGAEFPSLKDAVNYAEMGNNVASMVSKLEELGVIMTKLVDTLNSGFEKLTGPQEYPKGPGKDEGVGYG